MRPRGGGETPPVPFSIISFARFQEVIRPEFLSMKPTIHLPVRRPDIDREGEYRNDPRIEKTLYDRVNKRPSGPEKGRAKREEAEKTDDDGVGGALICKAQDFLAWVYHRLQRVTHLSLFCVTEICVHDAIFKLFPSLMIINTLA